MAKHKKGDTLIEVMLAIGIFSMVAIAVTSVISGSTSSAQTALEATLTREEIDAQAEALRFIQAAYLSEKGTNASGSNIYESLWNAITYSAIYSDADDISAYPPDTCDTMYDNLSDGAFVINTRRLGDFDTEHLSDVFILKLDPSNRDKFVLASTYPHLIFGDITNNTDTSGLVSDTSTSLYRAEGIYIIAVADPDKKINGDDPDYYDFYIRTCWYGTGDRNASTISTVIRLYNPAVIQPADI